jgi:hypothetical protein
MARHNPPALVIHLAGLLLASGQAVLAQVPIEITPHSATPAPTNKPAAKHLKRPALAPSSPKREPKPAPGSAAHALPSPPGAKVDAAYAAYQTGHFLTAFAEAMRRVQQDGDEKAMTLLAELYANGEGVPNDDGRALSWYSLAAERGNREAMFALALFKLKGRGAPRDRDGATDLLVRAAKLGHVAANYDLALVYLEGQQFPRDFAHAAELFRTAADAGMPEAQYALATLYKAGQGVAKDVSAATKLLAAASRSGNLDAMIEYAIALFNGTGVDKDEAGAGALLTKAAQRGSPIAQNRLARMLAAGRGIPADAVGATKWHIISKAGGESDPWLDAFVINLAPADREAGEQRAKAWLARVPPPPPRS